MATIDDIDIQIEIQSLETNVLDFTDLTPEQQMGVQDLLQENQKSLYPKVLDIMNNEHFGQTTPQDTDYERAMRGV